MTWNASSSLVEGQEERTHNSGHLKVQRMNWQNLFFFLAVVTMAAAQNGFFESIGNFFRPRRQSSFFNNNFNRFRNQGRPVATTNQASNTFNTNQQGTANSGFNFNNNANNNQFRGTLNSNRGQANRFNQQATRVNSNQNQNQAFVGDLGFRSQNTVQAQGNRFNAQNSNNNNAGFRGISNTNQLAYRTCAKSEPAPSCPPTAPNYQFNGQQFVLTWLVECQNCECNKFTGDQAAEYCQSMGAQAVSLDTPLKAEHFRNVSADYAKRYYWTGGRMQYPEQSLRWPSGRVETFVKGQGEWSFTGGSKSKGPQPDNRNQVEDGCEPEFCVAVLNNFYRDGIKWHDVACHHKKPTICEFPLHQG